MTNHGKILRSFVAAILVLLTVSAEKAYGQSEKDRTALHKTSEEIRAAFAHGDVAAILSYHHPDVVKALGFHRTLNGRDAVEADLRKTLEQFRLEFVENHVESLLIHGDTAVEQTMFAIKVIPKDGGAANLFKGRTQVVYVRYEKSPTGWASIREIIQPATEQ